MQLKLMAPHIRAIKSAQLVMPPPSASTQVKTGDRIDIVREQLPWRLEVTGIPARRGPAREARGCYDEDSAICAVRQELIAGRKMDRLQMPVTDGRPDKHTRRKLRERRRS